MTDTPAALSHCRTKFEPMKPASSGEQNCVEAGGAHPVQYMAQNKKDCSQIRPVFPFQYICGEEVQQVRNFFDILKVVLFRTHPVPAQATLLIKDLGDSDL